MLTDQDKREITEQINAGIRAALSASRNAPSGDAPNPKADRSAMLRRIARNLKELDGDLKTLLDDDRSLWWTKACCIAIINNSEQLVTCIEGKANVVFADLQEAGCSRGSGQPSHLSHVLKNHPLSHPNPVTALNPFPDDPSL